MTEGSIRDNNKALIEQEDAGYPPKCSSSVGISHFLNIVGLARMCPVTQTSQKSSI